jgi:hypothetical protein
LELLQLPSRRVGKVKARGFAVTSSLLAAPQLDGGGWFE